MKESSWEDCIETNSSLKISPDKAKANSLIDTAKGRVAYLKTNRITEGNANYIFEGYYTSIMEILHALAFLKGYNISSHICLGYYLRDILKRNDLFRLFDDCRFKRNSLVYYGRRMDFETAKEAIKRSISLLEKLNLLLKKS